MRTSLSLSMQIESEFILQNQKPVTVTGYLKGKIVFGSLRMRHIKPSIFLYEELKALVTKSEPCRKG